MGIAERKEREKEQRRNDILDAAETVFFSKGLEQATMDDVAEQAELSKGTLYLYFKSKEELYLGINLRGLHILHQMFKDAISPQTTGIEKVRAIGQAYFGFAQKYPDYFNALLYFEVSEFDLTDRQSLATQCHQFGEQTLQVVAEAIQIGIEDGSIRSDLDPLKTAMILWGQSTGVIQIIAIRGNHIKQFHRFNPEELITDLFDFIFHALSANQTE